MNKFVDITGQTFGGRIVLGFSHQNPRSRNYFWKALCECGREDIVSGTNLRRKNSCQACSGKINGRKGLYARSAGKPVYFIRCGDYVKIGSSDNIQRRLKDMKTNNPYELELIGEDEDEEFWHRVFRHRHHRGEWYFWPRQT